VEKGCFSQNAFEVKSGRRGVDPCKGGFLDQAKGEKKLKPTPLKVESTRSEKKKTRLLEEESFGKGKKKNVWGVGAVCGNTTVGKSTRRSGPKRF